MKVKRVTSTVEKDSPLVIGGAVTKSHGNPVAVRYSRITEKGRRLYDAIKRAIEEMKVASSGG